MYFQEMKNFPENWIKSFPVPDEYSHKYTRGSAVVFGAPSLTGATRLVASACARLCGAVSVCAPNGTGDIYRTSLPAHIMVRDFKDGQPQDYFSDKRVKSVIAGSGGGYGDDFFRRLEFQAWEQDHLNALVLDAEGFKALRGVDFDKLAEDTTVSTIVTPHEGEFEFVFPDIKGDRIDRAREAAKHINAVIVLKGAQTIIAMHGRETVINETASPYLATAGSGDVLSGIIGGLTASGMPAFEAACAGVWLHGRASEMLGAGMVASDIVEIIPKTLKEVLGI